MQTTLPSLPTWQTYADEIVSRLRDVPCSKDDLEFDMAAPPENAALIDDTAKAAATNMRLSPDAGSDPSAADRDAAGITTPSLPQRTLPARELSLAIRLAALVGSAEAMQALFAPGAITFIAGLDGPDIMTALQVIRLGMLPQGMKTTDDPDQIGALAKTGYASVGDDAALLLLYPNVIADAVSKAALVHVLEQIDDAIDSNLPIIAVLPDAADLPEVLRQPGASTILQLPPLSAEFLITHLRYSHGSMSDEAALRATLPDADTLRALPFSTLRLALRAPTASAVASLLAGASPQRKPVRSAAPHLDAIAGNTPALIAARQLVADLQLWKKGEIAWTDLSRSMLLYGPPGTGKTWLTRAMGNAAGIGLEEASFAIWQSAGHLGDMLREMRKSFASARAKAPCILVIDEIDAVGSRSDDDSNGRGYRTQVINAFLGEMDAISRSAGVIVIGACNDPSRIDPAVQRAGRFDLKVQMALPDAAMIAGILRHHLAGEIGEEDLAPLAPSAVGRSAAEIDAGLRAARAEARHSGLPFSAEMIQRHLGPSSNPRQIAADWRVAVHECGHAIVGAALGCGQVQRVMITTSGGVTHRVETPNEALLCDLLNEIACVLAGRAAEQLMLGNISAGAGGGITSDLALATRTALAIETTLGLGEDGPLWDGHSGELALHQPIARLRIRQRLDDAERRAGHILAAQAGLLRAMARDLLDKRALAGPELAAWLSTARPGSDARRDPDGGADDIAARALRPAPSISAGNAFPDRPSIAAPSPG